MISGYHYTSLRCWEKIQVEGLKPYSICKPALRDYIGTEQVKGIWLWQNRLYGLPHIGSILYQMANKGTTKAVLLDVGYCKADALCTDAGLIILHHSGIIGILNYHTGEETAVVHLKAIHQCRIELLEEFDLLDIWNT